MWATQPFVPPVARARDIYLLFPRADARGFTMSLATQAQEFIFFANSPAESGRPRSQVFENWGLT